MAWVEVERKQLYNEDFIQLELGGIESIKSIESGNIN